MRTHKLLLSSAVVITMFLSTVSYGAIYYIDDGGETNAAGSSFVAAPSGNWYHSSGGYCYGSDYRVANSGTVGTRTATYTFGGPTGDYYVYAGWSPPINPADRTQNGTITVTGTSSTIVANPINHEKLADGSANTADLRGSGFYPIKSGVIQQPITMGPGSTIVYTDGTDGQNMSADVVLLSTDLIIDNVSTLTTAPAAYSIQWNQYTDNLGEYSYGYHYAPAPAVTDIFEYDLGAALSAGPAQPKELKVSWLPTNSRDTSVTYRVTHADGSADVTVNQRQNAAGVTAPLVWSDFRSLGLFRFDASSKLEVIPSGSGAVAPDTIMLGRVAQRNRPGIVADFDDINTSIKVDGYPGTAGKGWATAWSTTNAGTVGNVIIANPIEGPDDPYLVVTASTNADHQVRRQYQEYAGLDPGKRHHITWKWRFDGDINEMTAFEDRIHFFGNSAAKTGTDASLSWLISFTPDSGNYTIPEGEWWFFDSTKSGSYNSSYNIANMVPTGIGLEADTVYTFDVELFPETGTYNATIWSDAGSFAAYGLTFRNGGTGVYDWLHFGGHSTGGDYWTFAFDSLEIYVPEPSALGLLILAMPGLLLLGRQSTRGRRRSA